MTDGQDKGTPAALPEGADLAIDFSRPDLFQLDAVSPEILERSRKNMSVILQSINEHTGTAVAERMGVHESQISRFKSNGPLTFAARLLASVGLKVVPADAIVFVQPDEFK